MSTRGRPPVIMPNVFTDPEDFYSLHPGIAEEIDSAAELLREAHRCTSADDISERLLRAEGATMRANAALAEVVGTDVDPARLLPLVRLAVEASAHQVPPGAGSGCQAAVSGEHGGHDHVLDDHQRAG